MQTATVADSSLSQREARGNGIKCIPQNELTPKVRKLGHLKTNFQELLVEDSPQNVTPPSTLGAPAERLFEVLRKCLRCRNMEKAA